MTAKAIKIISIDGDEHEILFSERTGRFACAEKWTPTPNFYATEQDAIDKAVSVIAAARNKSTSEITVSPK